MGEQIKILDLAEQFIKLNGFEPYKDIDIKFIGLRAGERMEEPLWTSFENPIQTQYDKILQIKNDVSEKLEFYDEFIENLHDICFYNKDFAEKYRNRDILMKTICEFVPELKEFYK